MPTETITLDRDTAERLVVELAALGSLDIIRNGRVESWFTKELDRVEADVRYTLFGEDVAEDVLDATYDRSRECAEGLWRAFVERTGGLDDAS